MVKQTLLAVVLDKISSKFSSYETQDWKILLQDDLNLLLPSFNKTLLLLLPNSLSCSSYQEIVKAFSNVYKSLLEETKNDFYKDFIKPYMVQQSSLTGVACDTLDFKSWVNMNIGNFIQQSPSEDIVMFNKNLTKVENPAELTVTELATFTFTVDSLNNQTLATILLSRIKEFKSYGEILGYLTTIQNSICQSNDPASTMSSCSQPQSQLSIHTQQEILTNCFIVLNEEWISTNMTMWLQIFDILVEVFLPAFDETTLSQLPLDISCGEYQAIIKTLSDVHSQISEGLTKSVNSYSISYLTAQQKSTGSACLSGIKDSTEWISKNFGAFSSSANVSDFKALYPGFDAGVLPVVLTPNNMAELLIKADVLSNETLMISILSHIDTENVTDYVTSISTAAQKENVSDLQLAMVKQTLLAVVLDKISSKFSSYETQDWKILLQDDLNLLLPSFNKTLLLLLPTSLSCSSYQEIVKAFSNVYTSLLEETKNDFYKDFIKPYMVQQSSLTGIACDTLDFKSWVNMNIGNFIQQSPSEDIVMFNKNLTKVENPAELTVTELATFTFTVDSLNNHTLATILLSRIKEFKSYDEILGYLTTIQNSVCQLNDPASTMSSCSQPLSQLSIHTQQEILTNCFIVLNEEWISTNMTMWLQIFDILVELFLPAFDETTLSQLPLDISCQEYQAIIKTLSEVHSQISEGLTKSVYAYSISYLTAQQKSTGSACLSGIKDSTEWISKNFGAFSSSANVSDFRALYPGFDAGVLPVVLTPNNMAELLIKADVLSNETLMISILSRIDTENVTDYVTSISTAAQKENVSDLQLAMVKQTLLAVVLDKINSKFSSYETQDWKILLQDDLNLLLPSFNKTLLLLLPTNLSCSSYQEIVKAFSNVYTSLRDETKNDFYNYFIKSYMVRQLSFSGVACDTFDFRSWVNINIGNFIRQSSYQDIAMFNKNLTKVENPADLTVTELATFTFTVDMLNNQTLATILLSRIKEFKSYGEILGYLTTIQNSLCQSKDQASSTSSCGQSFSQLSIHTQQLILTNCFIVLNEEWILANMTMWLQMFDILVDAFLPAFDETHLSQLPLGISCENYQAIIKTLSGEYTKMAKAVAKSVYGYCKSYLIQQQKLTGVACDASSFTKWMDDNFGNFGQLAVPEDLLIFNKNITQNLNTLKPQELLNLLHLESDVNMTLWEILLSGYTNITQLGQVIDGLNVKMVNLSQEVHQVVFKAVWPTFLTSLDFLDATDLSIWLNIRFTDYLPYLTKAQLNVPKVINANCFFYKNLVKTLSINYGKFSVNTQQDIYSVFKAYLLNSASKPRCYSSTEDNANSWIFYYLNNYLTYCSDSDLKSFSDDELLLETFSLDPMTLELVKGLELSEDMKIYYAELMAAGEPTISLQIIPDNLLCYIIDKLSIDITNQNLALATLDSLKKCNASSVSLGTDVLSSILTSVDTFTADTFQSLGDMAVAILPSVILEKTDGAVLQQSLSSLSQVDNWSPTQASAIVTKLKEVDFQFNATTLESLGTLVIGVSAHDMDKLKASDFLILANNGTFNNYMQQAPTALKQRFVQMLINSTTESLLQAVPSSLASEIPPSVLMNAATNINEINKMQWTSDQAQVLFQTVLNLTQDYTSLSTNVLQGFTCGAAKMLSDAQFAGLIKAMKGKAVALDYTQLSCIAKRLALQSFPSDFSSYPSDVLLYMGPSASNCREYYSLVGKSNTGALPTGSSMLASLLSSARTCLGISGTSLTLENLQVLGALSCGLSAKEINDSDPYILTTLQSCPTFSTAQAAAIESQILRKYGSASQWTVATMNEMGNLSSTLTASTLQKIPKAIKIRFFPAYLTKLKALDKNLFKLVLSQLKISRVARQAKINCTTPLTTDIISKQRDLVVISYSAAELESCLGNDVLNENLETLGELEFAEDQLIILKGKLDTLYGGGIPEQYFLQLGNIAMAYSTNEIAKWNITRVDTLAALLQKASWQSNDVKIKAMVDRYLQTPSATLDGTTLTILSPYLCALNESQVENLQLDDIRKSTKLPDTTTCSQSMKNVLFSKMKSAYQSSARSQNAFYQLLKNVIGGARSSDLIQFANGSPEMDIGIFQQLDPNEVKILSAKTIKGLIGVNLPDLRSISSSNIVKLWASVHTQTEVNSLGLNILAGVKETTPQGFIVVNLGSTRPPPGSGGHSTKYPSFILALCTLFAILLSLDSLL
ncbi:uncharacterized protein LOC121398041 isoform X1 [Xenopus laevis]|uniref:Uncharacterized protein LOC121398041 isoform X1 n=2 Tax=Xenopus laevis TaxID=8355 RepID=A0A8J1LTU6_XENLA|nr:uncharacterized protein LOC121398041 isoform X1 [Xenopus laevis]